MAGISGGSKYFYSLFIRKHWLLLKVDFAVIKVRTFTCMIETFYFRAHMYMEKHTKTYDGQTMYQNLTKTELVLPSTAA